MRELKPVPSAASRSRSGAVVRGGLGGVGTRLITLVGLFILTPVTLQRAGLTTYGLFVALTALTSFLSFSDLGLANALMTRLTAARARADRAVAVAALTNTLALLTFIGAVLAGAGVAMALAIPWEEVLNAPAEDGGALTSAAVVLAVCLGLGIPAGIATKVYMGLLQTATASIWTMTSALTSAVIVAYVAGNPGALPLMVAAQAGVPAIFGLAALLVSMRRNDLLGLDKRTLGLAQTLGLLRVGRLFVFLQAAVVLSYQLDALIVIRLLGPQEAAIYATTLKFISLPLGLATFVFAPLWPAFAEAKQNGDKVWVRTAYRNATRLGLALALIAAPLWLLLGQASVLAWTGGLVTAPPLLVLAGALWIATNLLNQPQAMLLNGLHVERLQVVTVSLTVIANVVLSVGLTMRLGLSGPLLGTVVSLALLTVLPSGLWIRRHLRVA